MGHGQTVDPELEYMEKIERCAGNSSLQTDLSRITQPSTVYLRINRTLYLHSTIWGGERERGKRSLVKTL